MPVAPRTPSSTSSSFDSDVAASKLKLRHPEWTEEQINDKVKDIQERITAVTKARHDLHEAFVAKAKEEAAANMATFETLVEGKRVTIFWINDDPRAKTPRSRCVVAVWDKDACTVTYGATIHKRETTKETLSRYDKPAHLVTAATRLKENPNTFSLDHAPRKADIHRALTTLGCQSAVSTMSSGTGTGLA